MSRQLFLTIFILSSVVISLLKGSLARAVTWNDLRSSASANILPLRNADQSVERAQAIKDEASGGYLPTLKATASAARTMDPQPTGSATSNRLGVTASQNLFSGFSDEKSIEKADALKNSAVAARASESVNQRMILRKLFNSGLYLQQSLELSKKIVDRRQQNVRIVNLRYSSGLENKSSYLKTQATQLEAEADRDQSLANLSNARVEAARRSGRPISETELFEGALPQAPSTVTPNSNHPDLVRAQFDRDSAAAAVGETRAGWLPQLTADASAYRGGTDLKLEPQNHYEIGLTLSVPIYTPTQSPRYREATVDLAKAEISLASTQLDLELKLRKARSTVEDAKRRVGVAVKNVEASQMQAEVYRKRYTLGLISFQDWDAAESDFIKADKEFLIAQQNLANAVADLDAAIGRKLEDEIP